MINHSYHEYMTSLDLRSFYFTKLNLMERKEYRKQEIIAPDSKLVYLNRWILFPLSFSVFDVMLAEGGIKLKCCSEFSKPIEYKSLVIINQS